MQDALPGGAGETSPLPYWLVGCDVLPQAPASGKGRDEGAPGVQGNVGLYFSLLYCSPRNHAGVSATGKIRPKIKFAAFWCVFLTKIKVHPESW